MKDGRHPLPLPRTNAELLELCDYATGEDMHVEVTASDINRLHVVKYQWDAATQTRWMMVAELRAACMRSIAEENRLREMFERR